MIIFAKTGYSVVSGACGIAPIECIFLGRDTVSREGGAVSSLWENYHSISSDHMVIEPLIRLVIFHVKLVELLKYFIRLCVCVDSFDG